MRGRAPQEVSYLLGLVVSGLVVGLTVVALETSRPELAASVVAVRRGQRDLAIGNVVGNCLLNLGLVLGVPAILVDGGSVDDCHESPSPIIPATDELVWGTISFVLLFLLMWKFAFPAIKKGMNDRTERIRGDLDAAESAKTEAEGVLDKRDDGKMWMSRVRLRPRVQFSGANPPTAEELADLHHRAHDACFIANSVTTEVTIDQ